LYLEKLLSVVTGSCSILDRVRLAYSRYSRNPNVVSGLW